MLNKQIQLEIFEQNYKAAKAKEADTLATDVLQKTKFPTQACVILSCVLIVIILVFVTGIERGKRIARNQKAAPHITTPDNQFIVQKNNAVPMSQPTAQPREILPRHATAQTANVKTVETAVGKKQSLPVDKKLEKEENDATLSSSRYAIQVATYKKDSSYIQKEIANLRQKGFKTAVRVSGDYKVIFAGNFNNAKEAQEQVKILKKTYKDCFVTKI